MRCSLNTCRSHKTPLILHKPQFSRRRPPPPEAGDGAGEQGRDLVLDPPQPPPRRHLLRRPRGPGPEALRPRQDHHRVRGLPGGAVHEAAQAHDPPAHHRFPHHR